MKDKILNEKGQPMIVLAIGDVVGDPGMDTLCRRLRKLKKEVGADLTVVNGENATPVGKGITPALAEEIFNAGADVITLGNHTFGNRQICDYLDEQPYILRPLNYPPQQPGQGYAVMDCGGQRVCVANLQGRVGMDYIPSDPFAAADWLLKNVEWISTPRPPQKSRPWAGTSTAGQPPSGAPIPTCPPPTSGFCPAAPVTSPISV